MATVVLWCVDACQNNFEWKRYDWLMYYIYVWWLLIAGNIPLSRDRQYADSDSDEQPATWCLMIGYQPVWTEKWYRVTTHLENLEKSGNSKVVREKSGKMKKVRGSEIRCVFSSSKYSKTCFLAGALPRTPLGELTSVTTLPKLPSRLGRGHPIPFPQLLQPQLLNNRLSGLTLFFINMKQLLTMSVNMDYRVIFAYLYWKSQGISCGLESGHPMIIDLTCFV